MSFRLHGSARQSLALPHATACKMREILFIPASQRVFNLITLLVPGLSSLDAKLHSPGVTQRKEL